MACGLEPLRCPPRTSLPLQRGSPTGSRQWAASWAGSLTGTGRASGQGSGSSQRRTEASQSSRGWAKSCEQCRRALQQSERHTTRRQHCTAIRSEKVGDADRSVCCKAQAEGRSGDPESLRCSRRTALASLGLAATLVSGAAAAEDAAAFPGPADRREAEPQVFFKTPSGTKVQELLEGKGPAAKDGDTVTFHYVCRRSNGYYVYSTVEGEDIPASLPLGQGKVIRGLEEVLAGMRPGGKRRALIPPSAGYVEPSLEPIPPGFGPQRSLSSHAKEPLVFEVQLLKIK